MFKSVDSKLSKKSNSIQKSGINQAGTSGIDAIWNLLKRSTSAARAIKPRPQHVPAMGENKVLGNKHSRAQNDKDISAKSSKFVDREEKVRECIQDSVLIQNAV